MSEPTEITCSESNVDLKDKKTVNEIHEKTLADLIKNSSVVSPVIGIPTDNTIRSVYAVSSEDLGKEWALLEHRDYYFSNHGVISKESNKIIDCISITTSAGVMVLVNVKKIRFSDNSYRIVTDLVTKENVRKHKWVKLKLKY